MSSWHSPQSIYHFGHRMAASLLGVPVQVQEKADGSFFAFGRYPGEEPDLKLRSKGGMIYTEAPPAMFRLATETVVSLKDKLTPGWQYRGEVLAKPKHNTLAYDRVPKGNVVLFDILTDDETYLPYDQLKAEAERLGLEVVPQLYTGVISNVEQFRGFLDTTALLGGQKIEGVVVKPLPGSETYSPDKKVVFAKFVSEAFKEAHRVNWRADNPTRNDVIALITAGYATPARWQKAVQHLDERGALEHSPRDIGALIREIPADTFGECEDEMREIVWRWAKPHIQRGLTNGFPEWYKQKLIERSFEHDDAERRRVEQVSTQEAIAARESVNAETAPTL